ncbi:MAG: hypothetical protein ICV66_03245 [Chitinophagaceae bacterium]|nr:hypothetical protein [Chitinophagaceae bacterium]
MRKVLFVTILAASFVVARAQSLEDIQEKMNKGKYDEAKEKLDKFLADPKNQKNANAWYYKGIIYSQLAKDTTKNYDSYRQDAFNAFQKYYEMDTKNVMGTLEQNVRIFDLYNSYVNAAVRSHNMHNYPEALQNYRNALMVENFIRGKGFTYNNQSMPAVDTLLLFYAGNAAFLAKDTTAAIDYYRQLADAKIGGKDYADVYITLVDYYAKRNDNANMEKYLKVGSELYPQDDYWTQVQLNQLQSDPARLFAKYEELIQQKPSSYYLAYNYAVELFNYIYANAEKKPSDYKEIQQKLSPALENAIKINPTPEANLLLARAKYNEIYDLEDQVLAAKGADAAKRKQALSAQMMKKYDELLPYALAAYNSYSARTDLKPGEKANLKIATDILVRYYTAKKQPDKVKMYQEKLKQF